MALYSKKLMDHFMNPRNAGAIENADAQGEAGGGKCGDIMKVYLKIENGTISEAGFEAYGSSSAIAAGSVATELIKGKSLKNALKLKNTDITAALDSLPANKIHCSVLAEDAVKAAVRNYYEKSGTEYSEKDFQSCGGSGVAE